MSSDPDKHVLSLFSEVKVSRPSDQVVDQIVKLINAGVLKPGDLLPPERDLTQRFGISRNYVREGIKTLELYGIVTSTQGRGTVINDVGMRGLEGLLTKVLKLCRSDLLSLVDTRILLETEAARLAAGNPDPAEREALKECLAEMYRAIAAGPGLESDMRLHMKIGDMSRNTVLAALIRLITPDIIRHYRTLKNDNTPGSLDMHRSVVEAVLAGDPEKAAERMRAHLLAARDSFDKAVSKRLGVRPPARDSQSR